MLPVILACLLCICLPRILCNSLHLFFQEMCKSTCLNLYLHKRLTWELWNFAHWQQQKWITAFNTILKTDYKNWSLKLWITSVNQKMIRAVSSAALPVSLGLASPGTRQHWGSSLAKSSSAAKTGGGKDEALPRLNERSLLDPTHPHPRALSQKRCRAPEGGNL